MRRLAITLAAAVTLGVAVAAAAPPADRATVRPRGPIDWISWAPGPKIVFDAFNGMFTTSDPGATRRLFPPRGLRRPVWAPSGRLLALSSDLGTVVIALPTGKPLRRLTRDGEFPSWSPTRSALAFQTSGLDRPAGIWTVTIDGGRERRLTALRPLGSDYIRGPAWSPDGRRLAFGACLRAGREDDDCGDLRRGIGVFTIRDDGTVRRRIAYGRCPDWSPARQIALLAGTSITVLNGDGSGRRIIAPGAVSCPAWSPDGRSVAAEGARSLLVAASGTRRARRVGKLPALPRCCDYPKPPAPAWSPDGSRIAVVRAVEGRNATLAYRLYAVRVSDGRTRLLLTTPYS